MTYMLSPDAACAVVEDGAVVLHMGTRRYYSLNETGATIWRMLEDGVALTDIATRLAELYDIDVAIARAAQARLLAELAAEELVTLRSES